MREVQITVNGEHFHIKALDVLTDDTQFEVYKSGQLLFTIDHQIDLEGNEVWRLVNTVKGKPTDNNQDFINSIGEQIDSFYR